MNIVQLPEKPSRVTANQILEEAIDKYQEVILIGVNRTEDGKEVLSLDHSDLDWKEANAYLDIVKFNILNPQA